MFYQTEKRIYTIIISLFFISYGMLALVPAQAKAPNWEPVFVINLIFIICSILFSIITCRLIPNIKNNNVNVMNVMNVHVVNVHARIFALIAITGFFFMLYDRMFIRGISYSMGARAARYEWLSSSGGSMQSILGNLLVPFGYYCLLLLIVQKKKLEKTSIILAFIASFLSVFGHAALNGGRSNLIIACCLVLVILISAKKNLFVLRLKGRLWLWVIVAIILISAVAYSVTIISSSAELGNNNIKNLTSLAIDELYGKVNNDYYSVDNDALYYFYYIASYLFHGNWTAEIATSMTVREGSYTLYPISVLLAQAGVLSEPLQPGHFSIYGAFITMPGALFYDFGYIGLTIISCFLGCCMGRAIQYIENPSSLNGFSFVFVVYIIFIYLLWPILPGYGFSYINFVLFSFIVVEIFNRLFFKKSFNWF